MIILGGSAVAAAIANWDWWFNLSTRRAKLVHDAFGRMFARVLNFVVGIGLLFLGIADVSNQWPVSAFMNAWMTGDQT